MSYFFTSDQHFGHSNIMKHEPNRQFNTVEEMDKYLIDHWNSVIHQKDIVYILGDFTFSKDETYVGGILKQLKGRKNLIVGNHDYFVKKDWATDYFELITPYHEIKIDGFHLCLMHYPIAAWSRKEHGSIHLYGHMHNNLLNCDIGGRSMNVGVDVNDYKPISWSEIRARMEPIDVAGIKR